MERTLIRFVWVNSWRDQLLIVLASFISFPLVLASLNIPKIIVNDALSGTEFPQEFLWLDFEQVEFLFVLCATLLLLIVVNNGLKYYINIQKGLTGERILRRIRYTIYERVTRLPLGRLKRTSPGEVVQVIAAESEPIGGFAGEVIATPVYQGGLLVVYLGFILWQDVVLGTAAVILFPVQAWIIPKVQRIVVRLVQKRIRNVREMTTEISETILGAEEMQLADARRWHLARMSERLYTNFLLRYRIFFLKFAIKFANNITNNLTPFFFYSFGGYQVIRGGLDLGSLVAIIAAYKEIAAPWRELLTNYQANSDISARYDAIYEAYGRVHDADDGPPVALAGQAVVLDRVASEAGPEAGGVEGASLTLPPGSSVAVIGEEEGGRGALLKILAGLSVPAAGTVRIGGEEGPALLWRARRDIAHVGRNPHILWGTVRENVAYGLMAERPQGPAPADARRRGKEAELTGAIPESPFLDWVDYPRIGLSGPEAFDQRAIEILALVGLSRDLFARGLATVLDPQEAPDRAGGTLRARAMVAEEGEAIGLAQMVEPWDRAAWLENASVAENLLFAVPDRPARSSDLVARPEVQRAMKAAGIEPEIAQTGLEAAEILTELLGSLGKDTSLLDRLGLIQHAEREDYARIVAAARRGGVRRIRGADRTLLHRLAFDLVPLRHRLGVLDSPVRQAAIVAARPAMARAMTGVRGFTPLDSEGYVPGLPLIENILRGRPRLDRRDASPPIEARLETVLDSHGMRDLVLAAGLRTEVGFSGSDLTPGQRRRLALARALASAPRLLVLDGVADEGGTEDILLRQRIRAFLPEATIVFGTTNAALAAGADRVLRVAGGMIEEAGRAGSAGIGETAA